MKEASANYETLIYMIYRFNGQRLKYSTGEKVHPENWDKNLQRLGNNSNKQSRIAFKDSNSQLDRYEAKVIELRRSFELSRLELSPDLFKEKLDEEFKKDSRVSKTAVVVREDFLNFAQRFINEALSGERLVRRRNKKYVPITLKTHQTTLTNIREFIEYRGRSVDFDNIDLNFHKDFIRWLTNVKRYSSNSIGNQIKHIKAWMRAAHTEGLHTSRDYESDEFIKPKEETGAIYLSNAELDKLYLLDLSDNKKLDKVRDLFLIGCYTGLRYSDFTQLKIENISEDGKRLIVTTQKTQSKIYIPINLQVKAILQKYHPSIPGVISNQKMNEYLKELAVKAELNHKVETSITKGGQRIAKFLEKSKLISTHTARRSFATNAYLAGLSTIDIMRITGHKTETSFMKYIKITGEETAIRMGDHEHFNRSALQIAV
ncbi:site-specific integrase [Dyadobacter fanqingshengii]|uniref:Site-specific integrase n=1 Tax=Dyadobacter fanqingshengii TaxID=2906443 RepID=A0A9X1PH49_9BACT|nr:site-specific integrase [Dyadobacter fanqingshengii]MCF0043628.1 site-specific integrase [Dyadobacter fanqingshengii]USJ34756.1 site-specific integrase [Dyadobacter fanqingshengii]